MYTYKCGKNLRTLNTCRSLSIKCVKFIWIYKININVEEKNQRCEWHALWCEFALHNRAARASFEWAADWFYCHTLSTNENENLDNHFRAFSRSNALLSAPGHKRKKKKSSSRYVVIIYFFGKRARERM